MKITICVDCQYFTGEYVLPCGVNPSHAADGGAAAGCEEWEPTKQHLLWVEEQAKIAWMLHPLSLASLNKRAALASRLFQIQVDNNGTAKGAQYRQYYLRCFNAPRLRIVDLP